MKQKYGSPTSFASLMNGGGSFGLGVIKQSVFISKSNLTGKKEKNDWRQKNVKV